VKGIKTIKNNKNIKKIKIIYLFQNTKIEHYVSLRPDSLQIDFQTDIDVHDKYLLFKTRFPFKFKTNEICAEIPYGYLERKILPKTKMQEGKWEFPAQKYVDVSDTEMGVTIINNSKYGFSSNEKGVYLTLVHTPPRPSSPFFSYIDMVPKEKRTKFVDIGMNKTRYAIKIHPGEFNEAHAWRFGYEYNYPLLSSTPDRKSFSEKIQMNDKYVHKRFKKIFKKKCSLIKISNPNVILQGIKPAEPFMIDHLGENGLQKEKNSDLLIIRLYETSGEAQENVELLWNEGFKIKKISETDLLERELNHKEDLLHGEHKIILNFKKFEIKTLKVKIQL
ncbi:MAG: glycoside hydrolase family 38 C-terminal domain-containing protein, partial [Promethearchaeia archaeon]